MIRSDASSSPRQDKLRCSFSRWLASAASVAAATGLVFVPFWWLVVVGLALFFASLRFGSGGLWRCTASGFFFGTFTGAAAVLWFWEALPLDFLDISSRSVQVAAVAISWAYVSVSLGLPVALSAVLLRPLRSSSVFPLACAIIWPLVELGRMWSFAVFTWAPQSLLGPNFSSAAFGYAFAEQSMLLQLAYPWGLDALNFTTGLLAGLLAVTPDFVRKPKMRWLFAAQALCLLVLLAVAGIGGRRVELRPANSLRIAIVCEDLEEVRNYEKHAATKDLMARSAAAVPPVDVVALPEEISLTSIFGSRQEVSVFMRDHFKTRDVLIMSTRGDFLPTSEKIASRPSKKLVYDGTTSGEIGRYLKHMLMPLGEYAPWAAKPVFSVLGDKDLKFYLEDVSTTPAQRQPLQTVKFRGWRIGGLLCSDLLSPLLYRELAVRGQADVLVNLSNPFWFHGSRFLYWKTKQMAKVHAVQNRLPFLLANNTAPSFALDSSGRVVAESGWNQRDVLIIELPFASKAAP